MKILSFNAAYGNGFRKGWWQYLIESWRYIYPGSKSFKKLLAFVRDINPDVITFTEIDSGSYRATFTNQILAVAEALNFKTAFYRAKSGRHSILRKLPVFKHMCNAILVKEGNISCHYQYLHEGINRLVMRASVKPEIDLLLVHLALLGSVRRKQIRQLATFVKTAPQEVILTGDFNTFGGLPELSYLVRSNKLRSVNEYNQPTFPSWSPKKELDFFLVSPGIKVKNFQVIQSDISDHLPILLEIE